MTHYQVIYKKNYITDNQLTFKIEEYEDKRIIKVKICKNQTEE